ncbi:MAG: energy-coupling factor transporter transmembrane protein EcfT [Pedococcus sp.]
MTAPSLYRPSSSVLHRFSPQLKLAGLMVAETAVLAGVHHPLEALAAAVVTGMLFCVARVSLRAAWRQVRPAVTTAVVVGAAQSFTLGLGPATVLGVQIVLCIALAALVTLTTQTTELLDVIQTRCQPLRRIGIDPARVALVLALAIRSVPIVASLAAEVRAAHRARGARPSPLSLIVPLLIQTLRHAEQLGEALIARGVDD